LELGVDLPLHAKCEGAPLRLKPLPLLPELSKRPACTALTA
jgi:hypothetical protein